MKWFVPPVRDLIFCVLLFSLCFGSLAGRLLRDGGTGWHIRTGQRILAMRSVPRSDPFSISNAGKPWYAWEWLYEVGLGVVYNAAGLNGAVAATALLVAATFAWLFQIMRRRGADLLTAVGFLLLALGASAIHLYARPHVMSWLLTLAWWDLLESAREKNESNRLFWLPVLMVVWVNVHGGFLVGFVLLGIYDLEAAWRVWSANDERARDWLRAMGLVTVAAALASFINPYGYRLYVHIHEYLTDQFLMKHIQEFQRPDFRGFSEICFLCMLLLGLVAVALIQKKPSLREFLILVFAAWSGFYASRNLPVSSMLFAAVAGACVSRLWRDGLQRKRSGFARKNLLDRFEAGDAALHGGLWPAVAVGFVVFAAFQGQNGPAPRLMNAQFDSLRFPVAAVSDLEMKGERARLFSTDQWGGYLIFRNYPAVLVDDRHDLYGDDFFKQYLKIVHVEPGWQEALNQTDAELVLMPAGAPLAAALRSELEWSETYRDSVAVLLERKR